MSKMLKPLLLPRLVEERKKRESMGAEMDLSPFYTTPTSSSSEISTPATPTFSTTRGHPRYSGSASSMDASLQSSPLTDNSQSPTFTAPKPGKRSLPDVQEEPQERDEDFEMIHDSEGLYDCLCDSDQCVHRDPSQAMAQSSIQFSTQSDFDYDLADGFFSDGETAGSPRFKKRRAGDSPFTTFATKFNTRFPTFTRRWRERKGVSGLTIVPTEQHDPTPAISSRSSSIAAGVGQELQLPPTPAKSEFDLRDEEGALGTIDVGKANSESTEHEEGFATTPLLPPLMIDSAASSKQVTLQSPLESPSVAEPNDPFSIVNTPVEPVSTPQFSTPQLPGMPSPPLSNKPSVSSFHRVTLARPGHLVPSADIPPIVIADVNDEWANKLGHANFTIQPEPYLPESFDIEACRQLRSSWDLARINYTKHLVRTGEHYGVTSKTYKLTEEKWAEIDALWKTNNDITIAKTATNSGDAFSTLKQHAFGDTNAVMTKIPSLNDPRSEGKFPQLGDEDIVGPMVQATAQLQRTPSKKAKLMRFFAEKFPALNRTVS